MEPSSSSSSPADAEAIAALEVLEASRDRLHNALREAAFSFIAAQREEESTRGCFVSYEAIPALPGTLTPLVTLTPQQRTAEAEQASSVCEWAMAEMQGGPKPSARALRAAAAEEGGKDVLTAPVDPALYVSEHPSAALRACQSSYRRALQCVVEAANCQQRALGAAAAYAARRESR